LLVPTNQEAEGRPGSHYVIKSPQENTLSSQRRQLFDSCWGRAVIGGQPAASSVSLFVNKKNIFPEEKGNEFRWSEGPSRAHPDIVNPSGSVGHVRRALEGIRVSKTLHTYTCRVEETFNNSTNLRRRKKRKTQLVIVLCSLPFSNEFGKKRIRSFEDARTEYLVSNCSSLFSKVGTLKCPLRSSPHTKYLFGTK